MNIEADSRRLMWYGALLFLLGLLVGAAVPAFRNPRMGLASHLEGVMNGMFLILLGLIWRHLRLGPSLMKATFWLALYGTFANWLATMLAAAWGTGSATPIAAAGFAGTPVQEGVVNFLLYSLSVAMLVVVLLVVWGLRPGAKGPATAAPSEM